MTHTCSCGLEWRSNNGRERCEGSHADKELVDA